MAPLVFLPDDAEEERACGAHDCDVRERPVAVVAPEAFDDEEEERVSRDRAHGVVGNARRFGAAHPGWVGEEGVEAAVAAVVEVDVGAAVVGEDEVADRVGALDRVLVGFEGGEEPGVFGGYQSAGFVVGPELSRGVSGDVALRKIAGNPMASIKRLDGVNGVGRRRGEQYLVLIITV